MITVAFHKDKTSVTETFIKNHIDFFGKPVVNITEQTKGFGVGLPGVDFILDKYLRRQNDRYFSSIFKRAGTKYLLAEYGPTAVLALPLVKKFNLELVMHFHGHDAYRKTNLAEFGERYKEAFRTAKAIIGVSRHMVDQLEYLGAPREKLHHNCYGVNLSKFKEVSSGERKPDFVFVGRFVDKKAPLLTILAFEKVVAHHKEAKLHMIGDGYLQEACERYVREKDLDSHIIIHGALTHDEVRRHLEDAIAVVLHSVRAKDGDMEGTPNVILEAGAMGLPVVATRHGGIPDVIKDGFNGFLVEEGDCEGMAQRMMEICKDQELAAKMARNARQNVEKNYRLEDRLKRLKKIIIAD